MFRKITESINTRFKANLSKLKGYPGVPEDDNKVTLVDTQLKPPTALSIFPDKTMVTVKKLKGKYVSFSEVVKEKIKRIKEYIAM